MPIANVLGQSYIVGRTTVFYGQVVIHSFLNPPEKFGFLDCHVLLWEFLSLTCWRWSFVCTLHMHVDEILYNATWQPYLVMPNLNLPFQWIYLYLKKKRR